MNLPVEFTNRMKEMLGEEYDDFINTFNEDRAYGIRYNPLKTDRDRFERTVEGLMEKVLWADEGYYYNASYKPGKSVFHEAGMYYIQEPSAMSAVELLDVKEGEVVCDLCAAPGGKSTQIAGKLLNTGLLVSNEFYASRAKILSSNIERLGVKNCVVLNEPTEHLAEIFEGFFDKIIIDAPCSGEGMFRKDEVAIAEWSSENVIMCAERQAQILDNGARMLKPGGAMVYSTCTFSENENEETVNAFLNRNTDFSIDIPKIHEKLCQAGFCCKDGMYRLWPHKLKGEGHFAVRFIRKDIENQVCNRR